MYCLINDITVKYPAKIKFSLSDTCISNNGNINNCDNTATK